MYTSVILSYMLLKGMTGCHRRFIQAVLIYQCPEQQCFTLKLTNF